ncbi:Heat shock 70 kDa protein 12A [Linnemannia schmuckeri]|uniref:Heat shock 70 kDa protein 12A n=1 Tax=Linnemannia schmuckeri TaxID=64567 RepID=A0A9P5RQF2_9FUNG|nr:Heat shock 70 kDa protein 12A [Linnemannia schmuckeri]
MSGLDDFPVLVSIDFGTTFSGCAYAYIPQDKTPKLISEWPNQTMYYAKTPTVSLYKKNKGKYEMSAWGGGSKLKKGMQKSEYIHLYKFKTHLDETADLPPWKSPITVPDAIADYLKAFHEYAAGEIEQQLAKRYTRERFRYCLTVPAMWSDKAKGVMRRAAIQAGMIKKNDKEDRLMLVSEPEAAAMYCERRCNEYDLKHGDRFLICDAGGGTVDLIVYDIAESAEGRNLSEVTKGHGATCGSMLIDLNFGNLLIKKFTMQGAKIQDDVTIPNLVEKFAFALKPLFNGKDDLHLELPWNSFFKSIKDPGAIGIDEDTMTFTAAELKEVVFDPVVRKVLELIRDQLDQAKNCSAIFMVGGFGSSTYLLDCVKRTYGHKVRLISAPNRPEIAVVFGAVYAGLNPRKVTARATRRCYGVGVLEPFRVGIDPPKLMKCRVDGVMCRNRFSKFVTKGQLVKMDECISHSYVLVYQGVEEAGDFKISVYTIDGDPPQYVTGLHESAYISIPDPFTTADLPGKEVLCELIFYFGLSEVKVEATVLGKSYITRLQFDIDSHVNLPRQILFNSTREY